MRVVRRAQKEKWNFPGNLDICYDHPPAPHPSLERSWSFTIISPCPDREDGNKPSTRLSVVQSERRMMGEIKIANPCKRKQGIQRDGEGRGSQVRECRSCWFYFANDDRITPWSKSHSEPLSDHSDRDCIDSNLHSNTLKTSVCFSRKKYRVWGGLPVKNTNYTIGHLFQRGTDESKVQSAFCLVR